MLSYNVKLPEQGCNVFYGSYLDNYHNSVRTRYYLVDSQLIASSTNSYSRIPDGAICLSNTEIIYKPELEVYFTFMAIIAAFFLFFMAYRLIIHPFWRKL